MSTIFNPQTKEIFNRLNTNGNSDWTLSGSGTGEYYRTVADYDADSLFYAGNVRLTAGAAGSLAAGEFNLNGTTLTVRLPADSFNGIAADSSPDAAPSGYVKGFVQEQVDVISAINANTEADVTQLALINIDVDNSIDCQLYRIESDGTKKDLISKLTLSVGDTVYTGAFGLQTGEKFAVLSTGAMVIDVSINQRGTA